MTVHCVSTAQAKLCTDFIEDGFTGHVFKEHINVDAFTSIHERSHPARIDTLAESVRGNISKGVKLTINDNVVVMRKVNPVRSNQFRCLQRSFDAVLFGFKITVHNRVHVLLKRDGFALSTVQELIEKLVQTCVLVPIRVAKRRNEDIAALFHVRANVCRNSIQVRHDHFKLRTIVADSALEFYNHKEAAGNTNGQSGFTKQANVCLQHPLTTRILFCLIIVCYGRN